MREEDIVQPGAKTAAAPREDGKLGQTAPGDDLRKTKLVEVDAAVDQMMDPPTSEIPLDPPTAEVGLDDILSEEADAVDAEEPPPKPPAFGIVRRASGARKRVARDTTGDLGLTVGTAGVHVVKGDGSGSRDNVFGGRTSGSVAIGRIATKQIRVLAPAGDKVNPDDPDLPVPAPPRSEEPEVLADASKEQKSLKLSLTAPSPVIAEPGADDGPEHAGAEKKPAKKLDLSRLRRALNKLNAEVVAEPKEEPQAELQEVSEVFGDLDLEEILSEASLGLDSEPGMLQPETVERSEPDAAVSGRLELHEWTPEEPKVVAQVPVDSEIDSVAPVDAPEESEAPPAAIAVDPAAETLELNASDEADVDVPDEPSEAPKSAGSGGLIMVVLLLVAICVAVYFGIR